MQKEIKNKLNLMNAANVSFPSIRLGVGRHGHSLRLGPRVL
jgi:hypothetical protein